MKALGVGKVDLTPENKKWYERPGYKMTGETLILGDEFRRAEYVVFKGAWTRYGTVRDCGDHYIKAGWCQHDRIDKKTLEITFDVEDE